MKVLAIYGSNFGQAEKVLRRVAGALEERGHSVSVLKGDAVPDEMDVRDFEVVLIAASIVVGHYQAYIRDFVKRNLESLNGRPSAFISINGANPESMPEWQAEARKYVDDFLADTGWTPAWTATFSGALRYPRYNLITRWIMRAISRQHGGPTDTSREYEFTDWDAVDRFAAQLHAGLAGTDVAAE